MKLLMLTHRCPYPPTRGDSIRACGELEHLSQHHDVWLACVDRIRPWPAHVQYLRGCCRDVAIAVRPALLSLLRGGVSLLSGGSLTQAYFADARLRRTVQRWSETVGFDAVLTFSAAMAPYAELADAPRRVLDMNDVDSYKWRVYAQRSLPPLSWLYALEARRLAAAEQRWVRSHSVSLLVNERERRRLCETDNTQRTAVMRTGVDLSRYAVRLSRPAACAPPADRSVGTIGSMSYPPNVRAVNWFGRKVWPAVAEAEPTARWLIVGSRPKRSVRRWGSMRNVIVTGFVQDVRPWLNALRVLAVPGHDEIGVQTKLIEALAAGKAAVVTPAAAAGIDYSGAPPFLIAATPREFSAAVVRLLRDEHLARELGERARAVAHANYRIEDQARLLERWLQGVGERDEGSPDTSPATSHPLCEPESPATRDHDLVTA
ncbi:MAG: glycosyltransferase [Planctomycetes bacterium]|nr:glycosyltransferase [Planctomycetota bacterium]